jgi:hypothetical protein
MPIQRLNWNETPPGTAIVPSAERPVRDRGPARPDWGPRTESGRETRGDVMTTSPQQQAPRSAVARSADGRILRPDWGAPPPAAAEAEATEDDEQEADDVSGDVDEEAEDGSAAQRHDPLADLDAGDLAAWRKLLSDGTMTRDQLGRAYALSEEELDALAGTPARKQSDSRIDVADLSRREIDAELEKIAKIRKEKRAEYDTKHANRYLELLAARETANERAEQAKQTQATVQAVLDGVADSEAFESGFESVWADLPEHAQAAIRQELAMPPDSPARPASEADLERFSSTPEGAELAKEWGKDAGRKLAAVRARMDRMLLSGGDMEAAVEWFDQLTSAEAKSVLSALAGGR